MRFKLVRFHLGLAGLVAVWTLGGTAPALRGDEPAPNTLSAEEQAAGWKPLFDGKSLAGWNAWRGREPLTEGLWQARDGELRLTKGGGGDIYTAAAFENYEFSIEWKTTGNSGLLIRVDPSDKGAIFNLAPEVQIERKAAGQLYALYPIVGKNPVRENDWNQFRVRLENGKGTHWFNGAQVYEYTIGDDDWNARVAKSKFKNNLAKFGKTTRGHIGLQDHGAAVAFRNIKIRELPASQ